MKRLILLLFVLHSFVSYAQKRPKIGLVLSGGGARGFAHVGVLKVLEEANVPIDYIGGTSMGAIIGGLYAMGYTANQLDSMVRSHNWDDVLKDKFERKDQSPFLRTREDRYFFSFPFNEKGVALPKGLKSGHKISSILNELALPVLEIDSFSKLKIPFLCIATDIESGEQVVLKDGFLAEAIKASMAIPTYYTPVDVEGRLLVDGGLANNFPVDEVKKMGADIVIGVDVQTSLYKKKELNSMLKIMYQTIFLHTEKQYNRNIDSTDILLSPKIDAYTSNSFSKKDVDSLIKIGENEARSYLSEFKEFSEYLNSLDTIKKEDNGYVIEEIDALFIKDIKVVGLKKVKPKVFLRNFKVKLPQEIELKTIEKKIRQALLTDLYESINYRPIYTNEGVVLELKVVEKDQGEINVGIHYDNDFSAGILGGIDYRNFLFNGSNVSLDFRLAELPRISLEYSVETPYTPYLAIKGDLIALENGVYTNEFSEKISTIRTTSLIGEVIAGAHIKNSLFLGGGFQYEKTWLKNINNPSNDSTYSSFNYYAEISADNLNNKFFATKGVFFKSNLKFIDQINEERLFKEVKPSWTLRGSFKYAVPVFWKKLAFRNSFDAVITGENPSINHNVFFGGGTEIDYNNYFPFLGLKLGQATNRFGLKTRAEVQFSPFKNHYIILKGDLGNIKNDVEDLFDFNEMLIGYGLSYGYDSPIGPIELTVMESNTFREVLFHLNVGFWF